MDFKKVADKSSLVVDFFMHPSKKGLGLGLVHPVQCVAEFYISYLMRKRDLIGLLSEYESENKYTI